MLATSAYARHIRENRKTKKKYNKKKIHKSDEENKTENSYNKRVRIVRLLIGDINACNVRAFLFITFIFAHSCRTLRCEHITSRDCLREAMADVCVLCAHAALHIIFYFYYFIRWRNAVTRVNLCSVVITSYDIGSTITMTMSNASATVEYMLFRQVVLCVYHSCLALSPRMHTYDRCKLRIIYRHADAHAQQGEK